MKRLIIRALLFCPLIFLVIIFNYVVDPARLFQNKDYEKKMADVLISGSYVTNLPNSNYDERTLQKFMIQRLKIKKDISVFGSSRVMLISSQMFPGKTLLNNGLSSASLEDYISLYEIYRENHLLPSTIIIGVDPWVFNRNNELVKWQQFGPYYSRFIGLGSGSLFDLKIRPQDLVPFGFQQLISLSYFQAGIQFLWSTHLHLFSKKQEKFSLTNQEYNEKQTILTDGSQRWPKNQRELSPAEVKKIVQKDITKAESEDNFEFVELDQGLKKKFINLIQSMKSEGINIILYLPPYYPLAYDFYVHSDKFKVIKDVEDFLRNTSRIYDCKLVGSYNPHQISIPESSFQDAMHLRNDSELKRLFYNVTQ